MSSVHPIPTPIVNPATPPARQTGGASAPLVTGHPPSPTLPALTPDQDRLFEALAKGQTSPAELSATLNLPVRQVLNLLATPEITFHLQVLENAIDYLARHTTRLRHNLAFKSLESALTTAAAKDNPGEIRRIATLLLKPTPPLPDPEAEQAERAERITKHRRAVKDDAESEQKDAEYAALAKSMVMRAHAPSHPRPLPAGEGRGEGVKTQTAQAPQRAATPTPPQTSGTPAASVASTAPAAQSPSHRVGVTVSPSHASPQHHPAQPRAA